MSWAGGGVGTGHDDGVGALVTLDLPADSPVLALPWIVTIGPLSEDEDGHEEHPAPPSPDEIRAGFARIAARLTAT